MQPDGKPEDPKPGTPAFGRMIRAFVRNTLLASPEFPILCTNLGVVPALTPQEIKMLADRQQENLRGTMATKTCTHINVTGVRCGSPALRGARFCYYHQRVHRGVPEPRKSRLHPIAQLDSPEAIQASLMEVLNAIVRSDIDVKRAGLLLRGLHIASKNIYHVRFNAHANKMVNDIPDQSVDPEIVSPKSDDLFHPDPIAATYQIPFSDSAVLQQQKIQEEILQRYDHELKMHRAEYAAKLRREAAAAEAAPAEANAGAPANLAGPVSPPLPTPPTAQPKPAQELPLNYAPGQAQPKPPAAVTATKTQPPANRRQSRSG